MSKISLNRYHQQFLQFWDHHVSNASTKKTKVPFEFCKTNMTFLGVAMTKELKNGGKDKHEFKFEINEQE